MLKKILAALLVAGTVLTLAACDKDNKKQPDSKTPDNKVVEPDSTDKTNTDAIDYDADLSTEKYDGIYLIFNPVHFLVDSSVFITQF